jgi:uncharacterized damage-inducible protein DinB
MYSDIKQFIEDWKKESDSTIKLFENLNDDSLGKKFFDRVRTPGFLAWHITASIGEMLETAGYRIGITKHHDMAPATVKEIINVYIDSTEKLIKEVANWSNEELDEEVNMYGEMWTKAQVLTALVKHQIHHRGQLTVIMRMAGLKVPGMYGPSYEEWEQMKMQPME